MASFASSATTVGAGLDQNVEIEGKKIRWLINSVFKWNMHLKHHKSLHVYKIPAKGKYKLLAWISIVITIFFIDKVMKAYSVNIILTMKKAGSLVHSLAKTKFLLHFQSSNC